MTGADRERDDLARVCQAHFLAASWLASASILLLRLADERDEDDASLLARLADIRPADDDQTTAEQESDRDFLLDRARSHRLVAETTAANGLALLDALTPFAESNAATDAGLGITGELDAGLSDYVLALVGAVEGFESALGGLHASGLADDPLWETSVDQLACAVRFLQEESALFDAFVTRSP